MTSTDSRPAPIHLVDDDHRVAEACQYLLGALGLDVVHWSSGEAFLAQAEPHQPTALLLDMRMPGLDGAAVHAELRKRASCLGLIILTGHGDVDMAVEQMKLGAVDFLQKPVSAEALHQAIHRALAWSREASEKRALMCRADHLSAREQEVIEHLSAGSTNREIAEALNVAVRTVEVHRARVIEKMGASNSAELAALWQRLREARD